MRGALVYTRFHGYFYGMPYPIGHHYLTFGEDGWTYCSIDDFGNLFPTSEPFDGVL